MITTMTRRAKDTLLSVWGLTAGAVVAVAFMLAPLSAGADTVAETFEGFTCPGSWQLAVGDPSDINTSYIRDCGNGWTARETQPR